MAASAEAVKQNLLSTVFKNVLVGVFNVQRRGRGLIQKCQAVILESCLWSPETGLSMEARIRGTFYNSHASTTTLNSFSPS